jgi:hypothetical protein
VHSHFIIRAMCSEKLDLWNMCSPLVRAMCCEQLDLWNMCSPLARAMCSEQLICGTCVHRWLEQCVANNWICGTCVLRSLEQCVLFRVGGFQIVLRRNEMSHANRKHLGRQAATLTSCADFRAVEVIAS